MLIAGVGGQGVIRLGNLLQDYGMKSPMIKNVVGTETRGVSQREGSVTATARYLIDSRIYSLDQGYQQEDLISPVIPMNDAHLVLGLEPIETLRNLKFISEQTVVIFNVRKHYPRKVLLSSQETRAYPSIGYIADLLDQFARRTISMNFSELSEAQLGSSIYLNSIILGVGVKEFREIFDKELIISILGELFKNPEQNIKAFELGYNLI